MWVIYENVKKERKNSWTNILLFLLFVIFCLVWFWYSIYLKYQNYLAIEDKKVDTINQIKEEYEKQEEVNKKYEEIINNYQWEVENIELLSWWNKTEDDETNTWNKTTNEILNWLLWEITQSKQVSEVLSEKVIQQQKEQEENEKEKESLLFKWSFCILGSRDKEKKEFFNSFSYNNQFLADSYIKKMNMVEEEYTMYCFKNTKIYKEIYQRYRKKILSDKSFRAQWMQSLIKYLSRQSEAYYKITFTRQHWWNLWKYTWCLMKWSNWLDFLKYANISIYWTTIQDLLKQWVISNNCQIDKIDNIFVFHKNTWFRKYYDDLFISKEMYNINKWTSKYKQWYENINYDDWLAKFVNYLNTAEFQFKDEYIWSLDYHDDVLLKDRDFYYTPTMKTLFHLFLEEIATWLFNKNWFETYLNQN